MSHAEDLQRIRQKLKQLIEQQHTLLIEKQKLGNELDKIKSTLAEQRSLNQGLSDQLSAAQLKNHGLSQEEKDAIEKKINHYIKEIDRCISQLGN
jgi:regulator of replication initiation timing